MTDDLITVSAGGPPPDQDIPDGVYPVVLVDIKPPRTVDVQRGPRAGTSMELKDWVFAVESPGTSIHERTLDESTSTASGPKSKQYGFLTALLGGVAPQTGQQFRKADLVGRMALATVNHDEGGYPRIANLSALPAAMQRPAPQPAAQPAAAAQAAGDQVPF